MATATLSEPIAKVLQALAAGGRPATATGNGWKAHCPAHDDRKESISIHEGDDRRVLIHCHAGCSFDVLMSVLGLEQKDGFAPRDGGRRPTKKAAGNAPRAYPTLAAFITAVLGLLNRKAAEQGLAVVDGGGWDYPDGFHVHRFNRSDGTKEFRPFRRDPGGWVCKKLEGPTPLYHRESLAAAAVVCVCEGEKCADAVASLGLVATTSAGGAKAASKTDWTPLAGKTVYIIPDHDEPGAAYAAEVAEILTALTPPAVVKIVDLGLNEKGADVADWIEARDGIEPDALRGVLEKLAAAAAVFEPAGTPAEATGRSRALVPLDDNKRHEVGAAVLDLLKGDPELYVRGGGLGVIAETETGVAFTSVSRSRMSCLITARANLFTESIKADGVVQRPVGPPGWLAEAICTWGSWPGFRRLDAITGCPSVRADGSLSPIGYDPATRTYTAWEGALPLVAAAPTKGDAQDAMERLTALVDDFPWKTVGDHAVWVALVMTAVQRGAIAGPVPGFAFTANKAGAGKGLVIDLAGIIATGSEIATRRYPAGDAEAAKCVLSIALGGRALVHLDNLPEGSTYGGSAIDSALTSSIVEDRILGESRDSGPIPTRTIWTLSGNNVAPGRDAFRRWLVCYLATALENPHERMDVAIKDLRDHFKKNRASILGDVLTILRAFAVAGRPGHGKGRLGSFEAWDDQIRACLVWLAAVDILAGQRAAAAEAPERLEKLALLTAWRNLPGGDRGLTARDVVKLVAENRANHPDAADALAALTKDGSISERAVGFKLRAMKGQTIEGMAFDYREGKGHVKEWFVSGESRE